MTEFFDFLKDIPPYSKNGAMVQRLNRRHRLLIEPFLQQIRGGRVLDLACHDGRWSYALAAAGAAMVEGVEARAELIARFKAFPQAGFTPNVHLHCNDIFADIEARLTRSERFDVVAVYGIFYHIMDHFRLLRLIKGLRPKIIIIDSEFIRVENAVVQILKEKTENPLAATSTFPGQEQTLVGVPSHRATEFMADVLGMDLTWLDPGLILGDDREGMQDYFRGGRKVRGTCVISLRN